jgi:hypothetical protein
VLTMLLLFPLFSLTFLFSPCLFQTWGLYYSVYHGPYKTVKGSNFCVVFIITLFYPLSLCDKKGE